MDGTMTATSPTDVEDQLNKVEARMRAQSDGNHPGLAAVLNHLIDAGGKRVRPRISLLTGYMLGANRDRLVNLAAAVEMLHTATLVHDDLIDGALLRRGIQTINAQWSPAATVLTGDFIFARAAKLAADTDSVAVMHMFAETLTTIVNGEINQHFMSRGIANRDDYYQRIYAKTASMFELASGAAALLSPVGEDIVAACRRFGYEIGMAFQIVDDVLDYSGTQLRVGKPVGGDLRQGLITLPALYYLESYPEDPAMLAIIERNGHNIQQVNQLIESIRQSGSIEESLDEARGFAQRAIDILQDLPDTYERDELETIARYIVRRNR
jgi:geranylgeranyl pyrophosphate synthase